MHAWSFDDSSGCRWYEIMLKHIWNYGRWNCNHGSCDVRLPCWSMLVHHFSDQSSSKKTLWFDASEQLMSLCTAASPRWHSAQRAPGRRRGTALRSVGATSTDGVTDVTGSTAWHQGHNCQNCHNCHNSTARHGSGARFLKVLEGFWRFLNVSMSFQFLFHPVSSCFIQSSARLVQTCPSWSPDTPGWKSNGSYTMLNKLNVLNKFAYRLTMINLCYLLLSYSIISI